MSGTSRERFVEAMRAVLAHVPDAYRKMPAFQKMAMDCVEAFADAVCSPGAETGEGRCYPNRHEAALGWTHEKMHSSCRVALLKEIGL